MASLFPRRPGYTRDGSGTDAGAPERSRHPRGAAVLARVLGLATVGARVSLFFFLSGVLVPTWLGRPWRQ
jgi:hypothetical protein